MNLRHELFDPKDIPAEIFVPVQLSKTRSGFFRVGTRKVKTCQCEYSNSCAGETCKKCFRHIPTQDDVIKTIPLNK